MVDEVGYDGAFTFVFSPRRGTEAAGLEGQVPHPVKRERMERLVELVQRRAEERSRRFVGRTLEVLVEGPEPHRLRAACAAAAATTRRSTSTAPPRPASWSRSRSPAPPRPRSPGASACSAGSPERGPVPGRRAELGDSRDLRPHRGRQDRESRSSSPSCCAERGEDPVAVNCDSIQVYEGLEVLSGARERRGALTARAQAARLRALRSGVQRRALRRSRPPRDRRPAGAGAQADRRRRHRALPAGGVELDRAAPAGAGRGAGAGRARPRRARRRRRSTPRSPRRSPRGSTPTTASGSRARVELERAGLRGGAEQRGRRRAVDRVAAPPDPARGHRARLRGAGGENRRQGRADGRRRRRAGGAGGGARRRFPHGRRRARLRAADLRRHRGRQGASTAATRGGR